MLLLKTRAVSVVSLQLCCGYKIQLKYNSISWRKTCYICILRHFIVRTFNCIFQTQHNCKETSLTSLVSKGELAQYTPCRWHRSAETCRGSNIFTFSIPVCVNNITISSKEDRPRTLFMVCLFLFYLALNTTCFGCSASQPSSGVFVT